MDFFINGRFLNRPTTGVERYAGEVLTRLEDQLGVIRPDRPWRGILGHVWEQVLLPARLPSEAILWSPANTGPLRVRRQVLTLHDIAPLDHPGWYQSGFASWYRWLIPRLVGKVRRVVTDSEFSRERIVSRLGVPETRIDVVAPGVGPPFGPLPEEMVSRVKARYGLAADYVVAVGTLEPRKNLERLARAWSAAASQLPWAELVMVGGKGRAFATADQTAAVRFRRLGQVPDRDLAALYAGARMLAYVPLYEGFGLPPLEAMACGCPVLASTADGVSEAVGGCALTVDPLDEGEIAAGIVQLMEDDDLRKTLVDRGARRAEEFSWERTARQVQRSLQMASKMP